MFRATNSPIFRSTFDYIQLWYNAPILLPMGDRIEMEPGHPSTAISAHCTKAVYTVTGAPEDGRVCRPKHIDQIQIDQ